MYLTTLFVVFREREREREREKDFKLYREYSLILSSVVPLCEVYWGFCFSLRLHPCIVSLLATKILPRNYFKKNIIIIKISTHFGAIQKYLQTYMVISGT